MTQAPASPSLRSPSAVPGAGRGQARARIARAVFWAACLALIAFNAWWLARDLRPVRTLPSIRGLIARAQLDQAEAELRPYLERHPRHGEARMLLAQILAQRGESLGCAEQLGRVPRWWPDRRRASFLEGQAYLQADRARDAEAAFRTCVAYDPLHPTAWQYVQGAAQSLIALYVLEERRDEARAVIWDAYKEARDLAPDARGAILGTRLKVEIERIEPEEAASRLRAYVRADPGDWQARRALAAAEQANGRQPEADRLIAECLGARPDDPAVWVTWLQMLLDRNDRDGFIHAVDRMPEVVASADDATLQRFRGLAAESRGDLQAALAAYGRAVAIDDFDGEAHFRLAGVAQRLGRDDLAGRSRGRHRQIQEAKQALLAAFGAYGEWLGREPSGGPNLVRAAGHLADLGQALGWTRLASELRALHGTGR